MTEIVHTSTAETWDTYVTDGGQEVAVQYLNDTFQAVHIKIRPEGNVIQFESLEQAQQVLSALHTALAAIIKKGSPDGIDND